MTGRERLKVTFKGQRANCIPVLPLSGSIIFMNYSNTGRILTGNTELIEAREVLPDNISIIGGIEPTIFLNSNIDELEKYVIKLLDDMKGSRYVLANSDSCPPGVSLEKFSLVTEIVKSNYK